MVAFALPCTQSRTENETIQAERALAVALLHLVKKIGPLDLAQGIWTGYTKNNPDDAIGVRCGNCVMYKEGQCALLSHFVEYGAICRFAVLPDGAVKTASIGPDTIVGPENIDLKAEYNRLNRELFGGELGSYPIKWNTRKDPLALVRIQRKNHSRTRWEDTVMRLEFSNMYEITYAQFLDRLAHEMIHVYVSENNLEKDHHGHHFLKHMKRINTKGYTISVDESLPDGVKLRVPLKDVEVLLIKKGGSYGVLPIKDSLKALEVLKSFPEGWLSGKSFYALRIKDARLQTMPMKRAILPNKGLTAVKETGSNR